MEEQMTSHFISGVLVISITGRCPSPTQLLPSRAAIVVDSKGRSRDRCASRGDGAKDPPVTSVGSSPALARGEAAPIVDGARI